MSSPHPEHVLAAPVAEPPLLAVCEHYAGSEKHLRKAFEIRHRYPKAVDITADAEDGAEFGSLKEQVGMILDIATSESYRTEPLGLRLPDPGRGAWRKELIRAMRALGGRLSYLTLPKLQNARSVSRIVSLIRRIERDLRRRTPLPLHILIEHPRVLAEVRTIARMRDVRVLDFGIMDYVSSLGGACGFDAIQSPGQFTHPLIVRAKCDIVLAAAEQGVIPSHNVSIALDDEAAVRADARRARREFGFRRMWSIHPGQVKPIVEEMSPDHAEIARSGEILLRAVAARWAPIRFDGMLFDRASYRLLWWNVKQAHFLGHDLGKDVAGKFFSERTDR